MKKQGSFVDRDGGGGQLAVQRQHARHQLDYPVVVGFQTPKSRRLWKSQQR